MSSAYDIATAQNSCPTDGAGSVCHGSAYGACNLSTGICGCVNGRANVVPYPDGGVLPCCAVTSLADCDQSSAYALAGVVSVLAFAGLAVLLVWLQANQENRLEKARAALRMAMFKACATKDEDTFAGQRSREATRGDKARAAFGLVKWAVVRTLLLVTVLGAGRATGGAVLGRAYMALSNTSGQSENSTRRFNYSVGVIDCKCGSPSADWWLWGRAQGPKAIELEGAFDSCGSVTLSTGKAFPFYYPFIIDALLTGVGVARRDFVPGSLFNELVPFVLGVVYNPRHALLRDDPLLGGASGEDGGSTAQGVITRFPVADKIIAFVSTLPAAISFYSPFFDVCVAWVTQQPASLGAVRARSGGL